MKKNTICLAEDHTIVREGIKSLLSSKSNFEIIAEANDGIQLLKCIVKSNPDIVILDISMPKMNGLNAIKEIKKRRPEIKILVLTIHATEEYVEAAFQNGANGYLLKDSGFNELIKALEDIMEGHLYVSPQILQKAIKVFITKEKPEALHKQGINLTTRENQTLKLIAEGYRNKEIAKLLFISVKTVEKHRSNTMKKLGLHNTAELTAFAFEKGLTSSTTANYSEQNYSEQNARFDIPLLA